MAIVPLSLRAASLAEVAKQSHCWSNTTMNAELAFLHRCNVLGWLLIVSLLCCAPANVKFLVVATLLHPHV